MTNPPDEMRARGGAGSGIFQLFNVALRHSGLIVVMGLVLLLAVGLYTYLQRRTYTSVASFLPQQPQPDRSVFAGIAAQFGLSAGSLGPMESPQFYADLLRSPGILRKVAAAEYRATTPSGSVSGTLSDLLQIEERSPEATLEKTVDELNGLMAVETSPRTGVVTLRVQTPWPEVSSLIAERLIAELNQFNLATRQSRAAAERRFTENRLAESRAELEAAEATYESFLKQNRQFNSPELRFEEDRHRRNVQMRQEVVNSLATAFEQARVDEVRDTPVLTVVDHPRPATEPNARGTIRKAALAGVFGAMLGLVIAMTVDWMRQARQEGNAELDELIKHGKGLLPRRWRSRPAA